MRCKWGTFVRALAFVAGVSGVFFWWKVYVFSNDARPEENDIKRMILTKENAQFLNIGRRINPKFAANKHRGTLHNSTHQKDVADAKIRDFGDFDMPTDARPDGDVSYNVHAFYYAWYGNPGQDGRYLHWNHKYLPHWEEKISAKYPTGKAHSPPDDIGSTFYPELGPYSSLDESITRSHMMQMQHAGIGVLALSWYPPGKADNEGQPVEAYIPTLFDIADQYSIKVCFHIEPYQERTAVSVREDLKYITEKYGGHPAFYRYNRDGKDLPLLYLYDSYLIPTEEWTKLLTQNGELTIRGTELDATMIGLMVERKHLRLSADAGFDGVYTYFAASGFSYGSTPKHWQEIARSAKQHNLMFIPSVGPGYNDLKVRPWNGANVRPRNNGEYYDESWRSAVSIPDLPIVSITSFNEWHEGTQIEPASAALKLGGFTYETYAPHNSYYYLDATRKWVTYFSKPSQPKR